MVETGHSVITGADTGRGRKHHYRSQASPLAPGILLSWLHPSLSAISSSILVYLLISSAACLQGGQEDSFQESVLPFHYVRIPSWEKT